MTGFLIIIPVGINERHDAGGLSLEGIAIVAGIDRILDMFRTTTNIFGDNSAGVVVAALEKERDGDIAATPLKGCAGENAA